MKTANFNSQLRNSIDKFLCASAQTKIVVLYYLAQRLHRASNSTTPSAFFSQRVQSLIKQLQQLPRAERYQALEEILHGVPTRFAEAYGALDTNMKMAFWYRLANSSQEDSLLAHRSLSRWNQEQHLLLSDIEARDSNELISFLRDAVAMDASVAIA